MHELGGLGGLLKQRVPSPQPGIERHHVALADRIDRRIGDLGELLTEVAVERARRIVQDRERRVIAH